MSRRKQSNPKPLKPGEDSEWTTNEEGVGPNAGDAKDQTRGVADKQQQQQQQHQHQQQQQRIKAEYQSATSPPLRQSTAAEPDQKPPSADPPRGLRLNPNLATDPACRRMPPSADEPPPPLPPRPQASHQPPQQQLQQPTSSSSSSSASSTSSSASSLTPAVPELAGPNVITLNTARTVQIFVCTPCGIRFSSLSTLDAHQTYYCSRRQLKADASLDDPQLPIMVIESDEIGLCNDSDSRPSSVEPSAKSARTGKQYKCPHCSYSADKKVSLNRHMRMHSTSPVSVQSPPCMQQMQPSDAGGDPTQSAVDRYCQNCDIRFSNQRTYLAHKTHYCNTRHVVKPTPSSSPMSNSNVVIVNHHHHQHNNNNNNNSVINNHNNNNNDPSPTNVPPTHLALPTNPVIVVPYALVQNASVISAVTADGGLSSPPADAACVVLPDGTLQPIAQARIPVGYNVIAVNNGGGGNAPSDRRDSSQSPPEKPYSPPKNRTDARANRGETKRPVARPSSPLDLRLKRVAAARSRDERCSATDGEDEKENRRSDGNVTDAEDIVCAPSIPCMIMSPSASPPPSAGRKTPQPQLRGPTAAAHNGVVVQKSPRAPAAVEAAQLQQQQQQRMNAEKNGNFSVSSLLKFTGKLQQHENAVKQEFSACGNEAAVQLRQLVQQPPTVIAGRPPHGLQPHRSNATSVVVANSAARPYFPAEMTLRLQQHQQSANATSAVENALAAGLPLPHHQLFLKQGPSKCENCNIVFCKYQNFLAHKKHYCASRPPAHPPPQQQQQLQLQLQDDADKASPEGSPAGKAVTVCSPRSSKDSVSPTPAAPPPKHPIVVGQFVCSTCGVKFSSYDNLATHQTFYCPNRLSGAQVDPAAMADRPISKYCSKCKTIIDGNHQNHQCQAVANFWKCPACTVVFPSASAAQKHLDTHNGIKAFVCSICQYKGNTLRGLRTHVRMHFDKRMIPDLMEEDYVTCVIDENCDSSPSAKSPSTAAAAASSTATRVDDEPQQHQQQQPPPEEERLLRVRVKQEPQNGAIASGASSDDGENPERPTSAGRPRDGTEAAFNDADDDRDAEDQPPPQPRGSGSGACLNAAKYCEACDISFNYLSTFDAHKKYYCRNSAEYNETSCKAENANATTVTS